MNAKVWTTPNQLTLLRMCVVPFMAICVLEQRFGWALGLLVFAGVSDGLDGLLARRLHQHTKLGEYLDPIADKLMLSTMFLVLSVAHKIPWRYTVLVFSRDATILAVAVVLYMTTQLDDFRPSIFGKINTICQVGAIFFVLLWQVLPHPAVFMARRVLLYGVFGFTVASGLHYAFLTAQRLHAHQLNHAK